MLEGGQLIVALPPLEPPTPALTLARDGEDAPSFGSRVADLLAIELDPPKWLIPGYIQEQSVNILGGG
ncbi:MAG: hypothetical protein E6J65_14095 [Deltaproteobacteria bacterium]|nr:MAG: hypothetical protein E6J65_14095 [Deltaproteobacteria bacterium]